MNTESSPHASLLASLPPPLPPPDIDPVRLDVESLKVVARLRRHGHEAYLVGGCVRDLLAGAVPKDYDVATSAHPEEIRDVFRNSRLIGRRFRLAHVYFPNGKIIEVATFRATPAPPEAAVEAEPEAEVDGDEGLEGEGLEGEGLEGEGLEAEGLEAEADEADADEAELEEAAAPARDLLVREDNVFGTAEEDALRRDFTVNGLFYDTWEGRVIDYVGGLADLEKKLVRTIGDPEIRMREDPVRGLRAARIAAKLGFEIEHATFEAMRRHAGELPRCAPARVLEETLKLLRAGAARPAFEMLRRADILRVLLPAIEEVLAAGGESAERALFARLGALDALVVEGRPVTDAVMLATLLSFLPLHTRPGAPEGPGFDEPPDEEHATVLPSADHVLSQMSQNARLPRRIADRVRAVLAAQHVIAAPPKKKRRRSSSGGLVRTPHFEEALLLFEIGVRTTGKGQEALESWRRRAEAVHAKFAARAAEGQEEGDEGEEAGEDTAEAAAPVAAGTPQTGSGAIAAEPGAAPKKKRRRGGRRHRRGAKPGEAEGGAPPSEGGPSESGPAT